MSTAVIRSALCSFLTDQGCLDGVEHLKKVKDEVRKFITAIVEDENHLS